MGKKCIGYYNFIILAVLGHSGANPHNAEFKEGQFARINCSETITEKIEIHAIKYYTKSCQHTDIFGLANLCNGRRSCNFNVTNSNVGSSCGTEVLASLTITFKCIRHGGWSDWKQSHCPVTCGRSEFLEKRKCNNPVPNEYGKQCEGDNERMSPCGTKGCYYKGNATNCTHSRVEWNCSSGYISVILAHWKESPCMKVSDDFYTKDVKNRMIEKCNYNSTCNFELNESTFNVTCKECTMLDYGYRCEGSYWTAWSEWSPCSVSCGTGGTTIRSRECKDSLANVESQFKCEGNKTELRHCQQDACCQTGSMITAHSNITNFKDISVDTGFVQTGNIYTIKCCARIVSWNFMPVNPGNLTIFVLRLITENKYKVVGTNSINVGDADIYQNKNYDVPANESVGILRNDILGWYDNGSNIIGYYECLNGDVSCPYVYSLDIEAVNADTQIDLQELQMSPNRSYDVKYITSENRKPDTNTSNDVFAIPDHSNMDTHITKISIYDPDVGDYVYNYELDYNNAYLYFDTNRRSLHVKEKLPHTVGKHNTSLLYKLSVVDFCNNTADFEITVVAYNDPPTLTSVPRNVTIETATLDLEKPFSRFNITDPSKDNISCNISMDTDHIILKQSGYNGVRELSLFLFENYSSIINTSQSTTLELSCTDGTDTSDTNITIDFKTGNHVEIITSVPEKTSVIIPAVISIVCACILIIIIVVMLLIKNKQKWKVQEKRLDIVEYSKEDEEIEKSKVQNCYAELGAASDLTVTTDESNSQKHDDPSSGENAYNPAWR